MPLSRARASSSSLSSPSVSRAKVTAMLVAPRGAGAIRARSLTSWRGGAPPGFDPRRAHDGQAPLSLDSGAPTPVLAQYMRNEGRFRMVERADPTRYQGLVAQSQREFAERFQNLQRMAAATPTGDAAETAH